MELDDLAWSSGAGSQRQEVCGREYHAFKWAQWLF